MSASNDKLSQDANLERMVAAALQFATASNSECAEDIGIVDAQDAPTLCPACEAFASSRWEKQEFEYRDGAKSVALSAEVPVFTCSECGFEFLTWRAEVRRHAAVCAYKGVLTPSQIKAGRESFSANRAEYARVSGIGEASIGRYESGAQIQTRAIDRLMRLSFDPRNYDELRRLAGDQLDEVTIPRFRAKTRALANVERVRETASRFRLTRRNVAVGAA